MQKSLLSAALLALAVPVMAETVDFSYNFKGESSLYYGEGLAQTYDVAIKIDDKSLVGSKIQGISVDLPLGAQEVNGISGWLTKKLTVSSNENVPDICSQPGSITEGTLYVNFEEPYTITDEGVFVGYTFNVTQTKTEISKYPVAVVYGDAQYGLYYRSSRKTKNWSNLVSSLGAVSTLKVAIEGNFGENAVGIAVEEAVFSVEGSDQFVTLSNHGSKPVSSIDYSYTLGTHKGNGTYKFDTPIPAVFGYQVSARLPIEVGDLPLGTYPFSITIDKVNGTDNTDLGRTATLEEASVVPFITVNRPLVEEFTGLWCGWCPRGYVALETMNEEYGDEFVALAYHNNDEMAITSKYPISVSGFPSAAVNRTRVIDPGDIQKNWENALKSTPIADINVKTEWADETKSKIKATSTIRFAQLPSNLSNMHIAYALIADGLSDPSWYQTNYYYQYAANSGMLEGKYAELFLGTTSSIGNLVFNDVVINYPSAEYTGVELSVPEDAEILTPYDHSYEFDISNIKNIYGDKIAYDPSKLRVVAILLNSRRVVNCNSSSYIGNSGLENVPVTGNDVVNTVWYDLAGRVVANPDKGIYIRTDICKDGSRRSSKIAL